MAGAGVFRFQNGSLLNVTVVRGSGCVNLAAGNAALTVNYEITGGTGRFAGATGGGTYNGTAAGDRGILFMDGTISSIGSANQK